MDTKIYNRKPLTVEAVQITDDNIYEVAKWCGGSVITGGHVIERVIEVKVLHPQKSQTIAPPGYWILKSEQGYKIYSDKAFTKGFDLAYDQSELKHSDLYKANARVVGYTKQPDGSEDPIVVGLQ
jgi:hypothetical protein